MDKIAAGAAVHRMKNYWSRSKRFLVVGALLPVLAGLLVSWRAWDWKAERTAFAENLRAVEARIRSLDNVEGGLRARVEFLDEIGLVHKNECLLPASDEYQLRAVGKLNLVYDRRDPRNASAGHVVSVNRDRMTATAVMGLGMALALAGVAVWGWKARQIARTGRLFREGARAGTEVRDAKMAPGRRVGRFTYAFRGPDGRWYEGKSLEMSEAELKDWPAGRAIRVVYDRKNPRRNEPDIFGLLAD